MAAIAASLILLLIVAPIVVYGTSYEVTWTQGDGYSDWASKNIYVGDEIVFKYSEGVHDVYVVSKEGYTKCTTSGSSFSDSNGDTKYKLTEEGPVYFICSFPGHCPPMKLQVNVKAASSSSNNTSPTPTTTTTPSSTLTPPTPTSTSTSTDTPPTSTSKDNSAMSRTFSWLLFFGVSLIILNLIC